MCNDSKDKDMVVEEKVFYIYGSNDNEDHKEIIHPCTCNGGSVVAHPCRVDASLATSRFYIK